jgi:hypothetical protein
MEILINIITSQNLFSICLRFVPSYPIPDPLGREINFTTDIGEILLIVFSAVIQTYAIDICVITNVSILRKLKCQSRIDNPETRAMNGRETRKGQLRVDYTETQAINGRDTRKWQFRVGNLEIQEIFGLREAE